MKTVIDKDTGEIIEIEDEADIVLRKANEIVDIDKVVDLFEAMEIAKANYENFVAEFKPKLLDYLRTLPEGQQKIVSEYMTFSRRGGYLRESFDSEKFKKDYPELYNEYVSMTAVNESLVIKERKN